MKLWVTRTEPGAAATAERLRRLGHEAIIEPVLAYVPLAGAAIDLSGAGALAFTSPNAVAVFATLTPRRDLPVFTVGEATAATARSTGFSDVASADGALADIAALIIKAQPMARVVWPGPLEPAGDLVSLLAAGGVKASLQPVYETVQTGAEPPPGVDGVLIHSPKGAEAVAKLVSAELAGTMAVFAISPAAAAPLAALPFKRVAMAPRPNETALLETIAG